MIVVIFVSIILSIMTIGFIRIAINEQRQSTDLDLSQRAYYAAESGLEDARRAVGDYINGKLTNLNEDTCDPPDGYTGVLSSDPAFQIEYTCMFIDLTPAEYNAEFDDANQTRQFTIKPVNAGGVPSPFSTLIMEWHVSDVVPDGDGIVGTNPGEVPLRGQTDTSIPQLTDWAFPAMMEVRFITYPTGAGALTANQIIDSTMFLSPNEDGDGNTNPNRVFLTGPFRANPTLNGTMQDADCAYEGPAPFDTTRGDYACRMMFDFSGFPGGRDIVIRMTNHYVPTTLKLTMTSGNNGGGVARLFDEAQAYVDVTGRSNTVYRRVEAALDLTNPVLLPNYAIQSATDICKNFTFTDAPADFNGIAGTSCRY